LLLVWVRVIVHDAEMTGGAIAIRGLLLYRLLLECSGWTYHGSTWMPHWGLLGSMVRINGLFHLLINGIYWGYNLLILRFAN